MVEVSSSWGVQVDIKIFEKCRKLTEILTNSDGPLCSGGSGDLEKGLSAYYEWVVKCCILQVFIEILL